MSEPTPPEVRGTLHYLARVLREADHLEPAAQRELADLVEELGRSLTPDQLPEDDAARLASSAAHLALAVRERRDEAYLQSARERLEDAALRVEEQAPVAAGLLQRILSALADLGI